MGHRISVSCADPGAVVNSRHMQALLLCAAPAQIDSTAVAMGTHIRFHSRGSITECFEEIEVGSSSPGVYGPSDCGPQPVDACYSQGAS